MTNIFTELAKTAAEKSIFEPTYPSIVIQDGGGNNITQIPVAFINNFVEEVIQNVINICEKEIQSCTDICLNTSNETSKLVHMGRIAASTDIKEKLQKQLQGE